MLSYFLGKIGKIGKNGEPKIIVCLSRSAKLEHPEKVTFLIDAGSVQTECNGWEPPCLQQGCLVTSSDTFQHVYGCRLNTCVHRPEGHHQGVWGSFISKRAGPNCKWKHKESQGRFTNLSSLLILSYFILFSYLNPKVWYTV